VGGRTLVEKALRVFVEVQAPACTNEQGRGRSAGSQKKSPEGEFEKAIEARNELGGLRDSEKKHLLESTIVAIGAKGDKEAKDCSNRWRREG